MGKALICLILTIACILLEIRTQQIIWGYLIVLFGFFAAILFVYNLLKPKQND